MYYPRRRRRVRPSSHFTLVAIAWVLSLVVWTAWELGRLPWWRSVVAVTSGLILTFTALGWATR